MINVDVNMIKGITGVEKVKPITCFDERDTFVVVDMHTMDGSGCTSVHGDSNSLDVCHVLEREYICHRRGVDMNL